jgi:hypothetical protein
MKDWWQSKTVWLNIAAMLMALLALPQATSIVSPQTIITIQSVINIVLRIWFSNTPVSAVGKPDQV